MVRGERAGVRRLHAGAAVLVTAMLLSLAALAHAQKEPALSFEVTSVKRNTAGQTDMNFNILPYGRFVANNVPTQLLVRVAHQVQPYQIVDAPGWLESERYNVEATSPSGVTLSFQTLPPMLRTLLAERFQLSARTEVRQMPIYRLVKARADGKPGTHIERSAVDCDAMVGRKPGEQVAPPPSSRFGVMGCTISTGVGRITMGGMTMQNLARELSGRVGRIVTDATGLEGRWDLELQYTPDVTPDGAVSGAGSADAKPGLFTAVQEQLGLRLEADRGPVEVLIIDKIERPIENLTPPSR